MSADHTVRICTTAMVAAIALSGAAGVPALSADPGPGSTPNSVSANAVAPKDTASAPGSEERGDVLEVTPLPHGDPGQRPAVGQAEPKPAASQPEPAQTLPAPVAPPRKLYWPFDPKSPTMTGNWGGVRDDLSKIGIDFNLYYNFNFLANVKGGLTTSGANHVGHTIDWFTSVNLEKLGVVPGGLVLAHVKREWGLNVNPYTGAVFQVQDDNDGDRKLYIDQLWYEQSLLQNKVHFRLGFLDYQTLVDRNAYANSEDAQFFNQALDNNPIIPLQIGLGMALTVQPVPWLSIIGGIGDAQGNSHKGGFSTAFHDEDWFTSYLELGLHPKFRTPMGELPGNYRFGLIYDPHPRPRFGAEDRPGGRGKRSINTDYGFYISCDQLVFRENQRDLQGLGLFFRFGYRHGEINRLNRFWSAGFQYQGLMPHRDKDVLGFGIARGSPSPQYQRFVDHRADSETVFELYYRIYVTDWLYITPDVQYVANPGLGRNLDDAVVLGVRARISF